MNRFYSLSKVPFLIAFIVLVQTGFAQNPTNVSPGNCSIVVFNFDAGDEGFNTSPYAGPTTREFYWNATRGLLTDLGPAGQESAAPPPPAIGGFRIISTISPPVLNPNPAGVFDVGFRYIVPNPATDFFSVRIYALTTPPNGVTTTDLVATSFEQPFLTWSTPPVAYTDPANPLLTGFTGNVCVRLTDVDITNAAYTMYRVEITYFIPETVYTALDDISFGPNELIILPVKFIGLNAYRQNSDVLLRWDVAEEEDVLRYEVERSANGRDYTKIGEVSVNHKSRLYEYLDKNPLPGGSFYRVRNVDIDGKSMYSPVARMNLSKIVPLRAYPTPATSDVIIEHAILNTRGRITVFSADGRVVKTAVTQQGTSQTPLSLSNLGSGFYVVRFEKGNGQVETVKLLKK